VKEANEVNKMYELDDANKQMDVMALKRKEDEIRDRRKIIRKGHILVKRWGLLKGDGLYINKEMWGILKNLEGLVEKSGSGAVKKYVQTQ
jgi:hypothetical protein